MKSKNVRAEYIHKDFYPGDRILYHMRNQKSALEF